MSVDKAERIQEKRVKIVKIKTIIQRVKKRQRKEKTKSVIQCNKISKSGSVENPVDLLKNANNS